MGIFEINKLTETNLLCLFYLLENITKIKIKTRKRMLIYDKNNQIEKLRLMAYWPRVRSLCLFSKKNCMYILCESRLINICYYCYKNFEKLKLENKKINNIKIQEKQ